MKIIKNNYIEKDSTIVICPECKSRLEIMPDDVQTDRDGNYIICPCCHKYIDTKALIISKSNTLACQMCHLLNSEQASFCDENKLDNCCDGFRMWYNTVYKTNKNGKE